MQREIYFDRSGKVSLWQLKSLIVVVIIFIITLTGKCFKSQTKVAYLFQRTKNTATTIPTINRQNGNTMVTTSTVLRFSTLCGLLSRGLVLFVTDSLDTGTVTVVLNGLEVPSVGDTVVKLFGFFVF